jgi:hypothetical protein
VLQPETAALLENQPVLCIVVCSSLSEAGEKDVIGSPKVTFGRAGACQNGGLIACNAEAQPFAIKRGLRFLDREAVAQPRVARAHPRKGAAPGPFLPRSRSCKIRAIRSVIGSHWSTGVCLGVDISRTSGFLRAGPCSGGCATRSVMGMSHQGSTEEGEAFTLRPRCLSKDSPSPG